MPQAYKQIELTRSVSIHIYIARTQNIDILTPSKLARQLYLYMQIKKKHGIEPDALNSHFALVSTTDARMTDECNEVI